MKIMHFSIFKPHRFRGAGISKFLYWISLFQAKAGNEVLINYLSNKNDHEIPEGVKINVYEKNKFRFFFNRDIYNSLKNEKPDLVFLHSAFLPEMWSISLILRYLKIPYIVIPHGGLTPNTMNKDDIIVKKIYVKLFEFPMLFNSYFILALSSIEMQNLLSIGVKGRIRIINQGFTDKDIPPKLKDNDFFSNSNDKDSIIRIAYLGRIDPKQKGLDVLVEAIADLVKSGKKINIKIYIAGSDYENGKKHLESLINRNSLNEYFEFIGSLHGEIKYNFLASSDYFVLFSRWEGLPLAALEAIYCGTPIIISPYTGLSEFVNKNKCGAICQLDSYAIASIITEMIENKLIINCDYDIVKEKLLEEYNWEKMVAAINKEIVK